MKDNIVDFQRIRRDLGAHSTDVANDAVYSDKKKTSRFFYLLTPVRYLLAASLYLVVVIPLGILAGFRFLLQFLGGIAVMGLTIARYMGADVQWLRCSCCMDRLTVCGCAEQIFEWWIESRFAFRLFGIGERRKNEPILQTVKQCRIDNHGQNVNILSMIVQKRCFFLCLPQALLKGI